MRVMRALLLAIIVGFPFRQGLCEEPRTTEVMEVIAAADSALARATSSGDLELVTVKKYSTPFNEIVSKNSVSGAQKALATKLANRTYWMIYYRRRGAELGGDVGVFIDATSKQVIDVYRGR